MLRKFTWVVRFQRRKKRKHFYKIDVFVGTMKKNILVHRKRDQAIMNR